MSHLHSIVGNSDASAQYQAYLERTRARRANEGEKNIKKRPGTPSFDSSIDPDQDSEGNAEGNPGREEEGEPGEGFSAKA